MNLTAGPQLYASVIYLLCGFFVSFGNVRIDTVSEDTESVFCHSEIRFGRGGELKVRIQPSQTQFKEQQGLKSFNKSVVLKLCQPQFVFN